MVLCYTIIVSDACDFVYLQFDTFFQSLFFKWSLHFTRQVMNLVWVTFDILNKLICNYMVGNHKFRMNDKLSLFDCNTNKKSFCILLKCIQFVKFNSSINLSFFGSPHNEQSTYINYFKWAWSMKSSHYRADLFNFLFVRSKRVSSLVFVISGVYSCCFDEDVHPFTSSLILSIRLFFFSYTYVFQSLPLHYCFPLFTHLQFQR